MNIAGAKGSTSSPRMCVGSLGRFVGLSFQNSAQLTCLFRYIFNDFGRDFACVDATGENPQAGMIVHVEEVRTPSGALHTILIIIERGCGGDMLGRGTTWIGGR